MRFSSRNVARVFSIVNITLDYFAGNYPKLAALLEEEYIFNWLSWEDDNILDRCLRYFEDRKVAKGIEKLPDGFTHNPVF